MTKQSLLLSKRVPGILDVKKLKKFYKKKVADNLTVNLGRLI